MYGANVAIIYSVILFSRTAKYLCFDNNLQMYTEVTPSEPYDLIARESWVSDGSEVDSSEKMESLTL